MSMNCPFGRHAENAWKQKQYSEQGRAIPVNWLLFLQCLNHILSGRMFLGSQRIKRTGEGGQELFKLSLLTGAETTQDLLHLIAGNRMLLEASLLGFWIVAQVSIFESWKSGHRVC